MGNRRTGRRVGVLLLVVVAGALLIPPHGRAARGPDTSWIDAQGRVWVRDDSAGESRWTKLDTSDAVATAVEAGDVLIARHVGSLLRWSAAEGYRPVPGISDVRQVLCSGTQCLARTAAGRVFAWDPEEAPEEVDGLPEISQIAVSEDEAVAVSDDGRLFTWPVSGKASPVLVEGVEGALQAAVLRGRVAVVLSDASILVRDVGAHSSFGRVSGLRAASVSASSDAFVVVTDDGRLMRIDEARATEVGSGKTWRALPGSRGSIALRSDGALVDLESQAASVYAREGFRDALPEKVATPAPMRKVPNAGEVALIVEGPQATPDELEISARLEGLGFVVRTVPNADASLAAVGGTSLLVIGPGSGAARTELASATIPILALSPASVASLGLAADYRRQSGVLPGTSLVMVNPSHLLSATRKDLVQFLAEPDWLPWMAPGKDAQIVGTLENGQAALFAFEAGAESAAGPVRARRAAYLVPPQATEYTDDAWAIFDGAVRWAMSDSMVLARGTGRLGGSAASRSKSLAATLTGGSGTVLLVVGSTTLTSGESAYQSRLQAMGFTVQTKLASAAVTSDASGKVLVFVSSTCFNSDILTKFLNVAAAVVIQESGIENDMLMTGSGLADRGIEGTTSTQVSVADPSHIIAGGLSGTIAISTAAGYHYWGNGSTSPSPGVQNILTTVGQSTHASLYVYDTTGYLVGGSHPAGRRIEWGYKDMAQAFTAEGWDIFDRMIFWATGSNIPPIVNAGPDRTAYEGVGITLNGSAMDDGRPLSSLSVDWSVVSGPSGSSVTFGSGSSAVSTAIFSLTGTYVLRLHAYDGGVHVNDDVTVTVAHQGQNAPPLVNAGYDLPISTLSTAMAGSVNDDGFPVGSTLELQWTKTSGPGSASFSANVPNATVTFSLAGTYVLRLTATEKVGGTAYLSSFDEVVISSYPPVLMVVGSTTLTAGDALVKSRIEAAGFPVTVKTAASSTASDATGKTFVWVSGTAGNCDILDGPSCTGSPKFLSPTIPVLVQLQGTVDDMGMVDPATGRGSAASTSQNQIHNPTPISSALSGVLSVNQTASAHDWGTPVSSGIKVATIPGNSSQSTLFLYEQGATMYSGTAAGRRAFLGWSDGALGSASGTGIALVDSLIRWLARANLPPGVNAGSNQTATYSGSPVNLSLNGSVSDDGLPIGRTLVNNWAQVAGPATANITSPSSLSTSASFPVPGDYVLRLSSTEYVSGTPYLTGSGLVTISIIDTTGNLAPMVGAGPDQFAKTAFSLPLYAATGDDGLPLSPGAVSVSWTKTSGPGSVTFTPSNAAATSVSFSAAGAYVLRATASDGSLSSFDEVTVTVETAPSALMVVGNYSPLNASDTAIKARLQSLGYAVTTKLPGETSSGDATGRAVVLISDSANPATVGTMFRDVAVPVLTLGSSLFDDMQLTGSVLNTDYGQTAFSPAQGTILAPTHPIAKGLSGAITTHTAGQTLSWGSLTLLGGDLSQVSTTIYGGTPYLTQVASNAFDNVASICSMYTSAGTYIGQDFGTPRTISQINAKGTSSFGLNTKLQYSDNGTSWSDTNVTTNIPNGTNTWYNFPVNNYGAHRYWRLLDLGGYAYLQIDEVEMVSAGATAAAAGILSPDGSKMLAFAYPEAAPLFGAYVANARRAVLPEKADAYTDAANLMFDNTIRWLTERRAPSLLVVGSLTLTAGDTLIRDRLNSLGYPATIVTSAAVTASNAVGKALVFIAPSVDVSALGTKLRNAAVPIVVGTSGVFGNFALTGATTGTDFGTSASQTSIDITDRYHPLAAFQPLGAAQALSSTDSIGWGVPPSTAQIAAKVPADSAKSTAFGFEPRTTMAQNIVAPERRAGLWLSATNLTKVSAIGVSLIDAAIVWAVGSDGDNDGLGFAAEFRNGTNPEDPDTNHDGVLDGAALRSGKSATLDDVDGDGVANAMELSKGTDALSWDTDGDGTGDATDCFPLDATRSACPSGGGTACAPTITLTAPVGSTLLLSGTNDTALNVSTGGPYAGAAGTSIAFSGSASGGSGSVVSSTWRFGDGGSASGLSTSHTYSTAGVYVATLTVVTSCGVTRNASIAVGVGTSGGGGDLSQVSTTIYGGSWYSGQEATKAFDNAASYASGYTSAGTYLGQDFGTAQTITQINAKGTASFGLNAKLQYSDNGSSWSDTNVTMNIGPGTNTWYNFTVNAYGAHRYWRLLDLGAYSYMQIDEIEMIGGSGAAPAVEDVVWALPTGAGAEGSRLTKTAAAGFGNSGAASNRMLNTGDGFVEFRLSATAASRAFGFNKTDTSTQVADIDFGFQTSAAGVLQVVESGTVKWTGTYATSDSLRVGIEVGVLKYRKNGSVVYTSAVTVSGSTYPLLADVALDTASQGIESAVLSGTLVPAPADVVWTSATGVTVATNTLTKNTGASTWGDSGARSAQRIASGDGYAEVTVTQSTTAFVFGLGSGDTDRGFADVEYAIRPSADGLVYACESGACTSYMAYSSGDVFRVAVESGQVKYSRNGTVFRTVTLAIAYPLVLDTSLHMSGAVISNAKIGGGQ